MPKPNLKGMGSNQRQVFNLLRDNPGYYIQVVLVDYPLQELITFLDEDGDEDLQRALDAIKDIDYQQAEDDWYILKVIVFFLIAAGGLAVLWSLWIV